MTEPWKLPPYDECLLKYILASMKVADKEYVCAFPCADPKKAERELYEARAELLVAEERLRMAVRRDAEGTS